MCRRARELLLAGVPLRRPVTGDAEADADRIDFLTHALTVLLAVADDDGDVAVALDDAVAAALGARHEALQHRRGVDVDARDLQLVDVGALVVLGVGDGRLQHLVDQVRALLRHELQHVERAPDRLAAHHVGHQAALLRRDARVAQDWLSLPWSSPYLPSTFLSPPVPLEGARRRELAELVADHVLGDQHRDVLAAVVHGDRQTDHVGNDHRAARPGLDRLAVVPGRGGLHLLRRCRSTNGPFFSERGMDPIQLLRRARSCCRALVAARLQPLVFQPHGRHRMRVALAGLAFATTVRVVDRVHRHAAHRRADAAPALRAGLAVLRAGCARRCRLRRSWRGSRRAPCGSRPTSGAACA